MKKYYNEPNQVNAVVYGYLARTIGKVEPSKFNKIVSELGYDKVKSKDFKRMALEIDQKRELNKLVVKAIDGEVDLSNLKKYKTDKIPFEENNPHNIITPYNVEHQRTLANNREFAKIMRQGSLTKLLFDDIKKELVKEIKDLNSNSGNTYDFTYIRGKETEEKTLIVCLSDFHIGATILDDFRHGGYNYDILLKRIAKLLDRAESLAERYNVESIRCYFIGDMVESSEMRGNQKWGLEFNMSQQIAKGTRLLIEILSKLETIAPVTFGAVRGNHDRLTGQANKKDTVYNDSTLYVMLDTILLFQKEGMLRNTTIIDNLNDMYNFEDTVYNKVYHINHGDMLKGRENQIDRFVVDHPIHYLITGHIHNFNIRQGHASQMHFVVGSPMGYNDYSKELNFPLTDPSQLLILVSPDEDPLIQNVHFTKEDLV